MCSNIQKTNTYRLSVQPYRIVICSAAAVAAAMSYIGCSVFIFEGVRNDEKETSLKISVRKPDEIVEWRQTKTISRETLKTAVNTPNGIGIECEKRHRTQSTKQIPNKKVLN